jgi:hypothetical protein
MIDRRMTNRRELDQVTVTRLQAQIDEIHTRVYNGLGKELRQEVARGLAATNRLVMGILIALLLSLAGIIIEGRWSANQATAENDRNYKAIIDIGSRLDNHIIRTTP